MNPSTAFATVLADELIRCGLREAVLAPGSRSAPLALALHDRAQAGDLRLHVRIDERSASFLALGLAKASRRPAALVCTSGTAAAHFHAAVIEADQAGVPLLVLTADRPPELRGTGANQTIDQLKLYGSAVRWFCEVGVPEAGSGVSGSGYWRSLACRAWSGAAGAVGGFPGPVHLNVALREPLMPDAGGPEADTGPGGPPDTAPEGPQPARPDTALGGPPDGEPWTRFSGTGMRPAPRPARSMSHSAAPDPLDVTSIGSQRPVYRAPGHEGTWMAALELPWTERGVIVCGDGDYDPLPLLDLAEMAGWPVLAEPSSNARRGPNALSAYSYLLGEPGFTSAHRPDLIISAGRPGLSRGQLAFLQGAPGEARARHVVLAQGPGRWADPARTATDVALAVRLSPGTARMPGRAVGEGGPGGAGPGPGGAGPGPGGAGPGAAGGESRWLASWRRADAAARAAADAELEADESLSEPRLARDLAAVLPAGALLWAASSLPVRDLDQQMAPRADIRVLASRGASGIDGLVSSATGAALAHQAAGGGPAVALLGDLAFLHDSPGLFLGPGEPRPDLTIVVANNDGGGIFSALEQAAFPGPFERVFGTPHGADLSFLARAAGLFHERVDAAADLAAALRGDGLRIIEVRADRAAGARLRARISAACAASIAAAAGG